MINYKMLRLRVTIVVFRVGVNKRNLHMFYRTGGLAVAVPGELMGYWEAHKKYGSLPWPKLFEPTIKLCEIGSRVNNYLAAYLAEKEPMIKNESSMAEILINPVTNKTWTVSNTLPELPYHF